ncbi:MAG: beta-propeller fold lactonase family protein [Candidatus Saccharibacteria bacterium]
MNRSIYSHDKGYTLAELIVVIIVIGIIATVSFVSYGSYNKTLISNQVKSDLNGAVAAMESSNTFNNSYPADINSLTSFSPSKDKDGNSIVSLSGGGSNDNKLYCIKATSLQDSGIVYHILSTNKYPEVGDCPVFTHKPSISSPTVTSIASTNAILGANVTSDGGSGLTSVGTCWGTTPAPTTNCVDLAIGLLTPLSPPTISAGAINYTGVGWSVGRPLTVSPDGKSVYEANYASTGTISMFSRDIGTGVLAAVTPPTITAGPLTSGIAISADGKSVYATNLSTNPNNTISMYSRNTSTGALAPLSTPTITAGARPQGIAISADGKSVYVANANSTFISMYSRDTSTGALAPLSTPTITTNFVGGMPEDIIVSPDGNSVYVITLSNIMITFSRDTSTGALSAGVARTNAQVAMGIAISSDSTSVYLTAAGGNVYMYSRDTSTGALTPLSTPTIALGNTLGDIAVSADGKSVYVAAFQNYVYMYSRDTSTGALTPLSTPTIATGVGNPAHLAVSADGSSVYVANYTTRTISMFRRQTTTTGSVGVYSQMANGMTSNTQIYYRGYATNANGVSYSADNSFTTLP